MPSQLCQSSQTADAGVPRVGFLLQVIHHLVTVVGTHRMEPYGAAAARGKPSSHVHVDVAFQMVGFVEVAFLIALRAAQVHEVDAVAELFHQGSTVIGAAYAQKNRCTGTDRCSCWEQRQSEPGNRRRSS